MIELLTLKQASERLNVCRMTICNWVKEGKIDFITLPNGRRRYKIENIFKDNNKEIKYGIIYTRVSTGKQKDDLQRQIEYLQGKYPTYRLIKDIGSGINYKRRGFRSLVVAVLQGVVSEVVVAHKDRLCRFGFELIEFICQRYGTNIVVLNNKKSSKEEEMVQDLLSIITVFSCRSHGLRKYKQKIKEDIETQKKDKIQTEEKGCQRAS